MSTPISRQLFAELPALVLLLISLSVLRKSPTPTLLRPRRRAGAAASGGRPPQRHGKRETGVDDSHLVTNSSDTRLSRVGVGKQVGIIPVSESKAAAVRTHVFAVLRGQSNGSNASRVA